MLRIASGVGRISYGGAWEENTPCSLVSYPDICFEDKGHEAVCFNIGNCSDGPVMDSWQTSRSHSDVVHYVLLLYIDIEYTQSLFSSSMSAGVTTRECRFVVLYSFLFSVVT